MLNQVHIEGYVTKKIWQHGGDTFIRVAVYRDPDRVRKQANREAEDEKDQPDYITIRLPASLLAGLPVQFQAGQRVQAHGWLESREFDYTLQEFLREAQGPKPNVEAADQVVAHRGTTWLVAERILLVPERNGDGAGHKGSRTNGR
ncbi:MAG: hypothetical protein V2A77_12165 [Pseudomonadota bacterium]